MISTPREGALGPFRSRRAAVAAVDTVLEAVPLRPCTLRIPARGAAATPCALHELQRCRAPCAGLQTPVEYAPGGAPRCGSWSPAGTTPRWSRSPGRWTALAARQRFEDAARRRDRLAGLILALERAQRLAALAAVPEVVGARPDGRGGWELAVLRTAGWSRPGWPGAGWPPMPVVDALRLGAQTIIPGAGPLRGAPAEEVALVHRWLTTDGTRLVHADPPWTEPARSAAAWRPWAERARPVSLEVD